MMFLRALLISGLNGCRSDRSWEDLAEDTLLGGLTTAKFKQEVIKLFRAEKYASRAALDIGAGGGTTTAALAVNFAVVVAIDKYWDIAGATASPNGGFHVNSDRLLTKSGNKITNIVRLHVDTSLLGSFATLADQNFSAAVIDADHKSSRVARDTFNVLRGLPCCVETIIYHDYCDEDVYQTVQRFVNEGLLTFRTAIGERNWSEWWCRNERPEGVAMRVLRNPFSDFHERLERLYREFVDWYGSLQEMLNGSQWLLLATDRPGEMSLMQMGFWPSMSYVTPLTRPLTRPGVDRRPVAHGGTRLQVGSAIVVPQDMPFVSIISRQPGGRRKLWGELDRELRLLRLHASKEHPLRAQCRPGCMGINLRWSVGWALQIDHLLHVDELLGGAASTLRPEVEQEQKRSVWFWEFNPWLCLPRPWHPSPICPKPQISSPVNICQHLSTFTTQC